MKLDTGFIRAQLLKQPADDAASSSLASPQAAVLVLIYPGAAGPSVLLTLRSDQLPHHAGQISFPGGRVHHDDADVVATAVRESVEEVGLDPDGLTILGKLPVTFVPTSGFAITPVVGVMKDRPEFQPDAREVAALIEIPLELVLDTAAYKTGSQVRDGVTREYWYVEFDGHHVWGATARIMRSLALLLAEAHDP